MPKTIVKQPVSERTPIPEAPVKSRFDLRKGGRFLLEFTSVLVLVILVLEATFAWAGVGEQECLKIDDYLGFSLFSNKSVTWRREGFSRVHFNSHGMQDHEYTLDKPAGIKRIAIVGDSYVEALQVHRDKNFCSRLENKLENVQVMNFGIQAHNLAQSYLYLKKSILAFAPDLVIVPYRTDATFLLPPDIKRGFLGARANFFVDDKGNLIEDRTVQELWLKSGAAKRMLSTAWLREHSRIWGVFSTAMEAASNWKQKGGLLENFLHSSDAGEKALPGLQAAAQPVLEEKTTSGWTKTSKVGEDSIKATWPIADALLKDMNQLCKAKGSRMIIMRMPGVRGHVSALETELLEGTARNYEIPFMDLTDTFHAALNQKEDLFLNTHMTERGHELVAEKLLEFLKEEKLD